MQRSGSKLISKAGSIKNISKAGFRFAFELQLESCDQMLGSADVVCTWERGPKVVATAPSKVDKKQRMVNFNGAVMAQEVTMFKKKKSDAAFEPKVYRLTLRGGSEKGKIIGKIDLNFADYIEIPSFSKRIAAPLNSGSRLILRVNSRYVGEVEKGGNKKANKKKKSDDETTSVTSGSDSGVDGISGYSPQDAEDMEDSMRDLDDLAIDDEPPRNKQRPYGPNGANAAPYTSSSSSSQTRSVTGPRSVAGDSGGGPYRYDADTAKSSRRDDSDEMPYSRYDEYGGRRNRDAVGNTAASGTAFGAYGSASRQASRERAEPDSDMRKKPSGSALYAGTAASSRPGANVPSRSAYVEPSGGGPADDYGRSRNGRTNAGGDDNAASSPSSMVGLAPTPNNRRNVTGHAHDEVPPNRQEMERLRAENKLLRRENDRLKERLADVGSGGHSDNSDSMQALAQENRTLRRDIEDLESRLSREPVYADVVRELRESKMALAFLTLERDELQQKIRTAGPTSGIASRNLL